MENTQAENLEAVRRRLTGIEGKYTRRYYAQIFGLFPEKLRPEGRKKFKAYDGVNNLFNLAYELLSWKVYRALIKARLEPYLVNPFAPNQHRIIQLKKQGRSHKDICLVLGRDPEKYRPYVSRVIRKARERGVIQ